MAAGPGSNADVIRFELPLLCGSVYSITNTTPNSEAVDFFKGSAGSTTLLYFLNTWITLLSKIMEQLKGCDDGTKTKAFVLATMKDKAEGYTTRYFQQQMVGGLQTIATDGVTTFPTYTKLLEVLDSDNFDAEKKNKQILALLSTTNKYSEWKSPYDSSRPEDVSWKVNTKLREGDASHNSKCEPGLHYGSRALQAYYSRQNSRVTTPPISLFDKNPHNVSARLYGLRWVKSILMMWFKTSISM